MIKYEINRLHQVAQIGKEYCEHLLRYTTDTKLTQTIKEQKQNYEDQMHKLVHVYYGLDDISVIKSVWFSLMMKNKLAFKHRTYDLIKSLLKGNLMGVRTLTNFIQCPFNSEESKSHAREMLQAINKNIQQLMDEYLYKDDRLEYEENEETA